MGGFVTRGVAFRRMRLRLLCHVQRRDKLFEAAREAYVKRLSRYVAVQVDEQRQLSLQKLETGPRMHWVALEVGGLQPSTAAFQSWLKGHAEAGRPSLNFLVGGPFGLEPALSQACDERLSLSLLTLPHRLAAVVLLEQLYRAYASFAGSTYDH